MDFEQGCNESDGQSDQERIVKNSHQFKEKIGLY
jgi:hypothetical protein